MSFMRTLFGKCYVLSFFSDQFVASMNSWTKMNEIIVFDPFNYFMFTQSHVF